MAIVKCPDCESEISDLAPACVKCGRPQKAPATEESSKSPWSAVTRTRTPINVFALAMMACAAVFGASATLLKENSLSAFTYSLHTFLAVTGMFFLTLLFCRKAIYPPSDLVWAMKHKVDLGSDRPVLAAVLIGIMLVFYGYYQGFIAPEEVRKAQQIGAPVKP